MAKLLASEASWAGGERLPRHARRLRLRRASTTSSASSARRGSTRVAPVIEQPRPRLPRPARARPAAVVLIRPEGTCRAETCPGSDPDMSRAAMSGRPLRALFSCRASGRAPTLSPAARSGSDPDMSRPDMSEGRISTCPVWTCRGLTPAVVAASSGAVLIAGRPRRHPAYRRVVGRRARDPAATRLRAASRRGRGGPRVGARLRCARRGSERRGRRRRSGATSAGAGT